VYVHCTVYVDVVRVVTCMAHAIVGVGYYVINIVWERRRGSAKSHVDVCGSAGLGHITRFEFFFGFGQAPNWMWKFIDLAFQPGVDFFLVWT
jgi:hypothetical protein